MSDELTIAASLLALLVVFGLGWLVGGWHVETRLVQAMTPILPPRPSPPIGYRGPVVVSQRVQ